MRIPLRDAVGQGRNALSSDRPQQPRARGRDRPNLDPGEDMQPVHLGIHHRLLFSMEDRDELEVAEVVTREDLDRALAARR